MEIYNVCLFVDSILYTIVWYSYRDKQKNAQIECVSVAVFGNSNVLFVYVQKNCCFFLYAVYYYYYYYSTNGKEGMLNNLFKNQQYTRREKNVFLFQFYTNLLYTTKIYLTNHIMLSLSSCVYC